MPGAPPYPAAPEHAPPPIGRPAPGTKFVTALGAAAIWAAVNVVLVLIVVGAPPAGSAVTRLLAALVVPAVLAALAVWLIARRRGWAFWMLVVTAAPFFWVLRSLTTLVGG
jgi:hypothetical protein